MSIRYAERRPQQQPWRRGWAGAPAGAASPLAQAAPPAPAPPLGAPWRLPAARQTAPPVQSPPPPPAGSPPRCAARPWQCPPQTSEQRRAPVGWEQEQQGQGDSSSSRGRVSEQGDGPRTSEQRSTPVGSEEQWQRARAGDRTCAHQSPCARLWGGLAAGCTSCVGAQQAALGQTVEAACCWDWWGRAQAVPGQQCLPTSPSPSARPTHCIPRRTIHPTGTPHRLPTRTPHHTALPPHRDDHPSHAHSPHTTPLPHAHPPPRPTALPPPPTTWLVLLRWVPPQNSMGKASLAPEAGSASSASTGRPTDTTRTGSGYTSPNTARRPLMALACGGSGIGGGSRV